MASVLLFCDFCLNYGVDIYDVNAEIDNEVDSKFKIEKLRDTVVHLLDNQVNC